MKIDYKQFPSGKQYACIRDGETCIFLRNIAFLHPANDPHKVVVVHEWGSRMDRDWEPPKGQMEWKEFAAEGFRKGQTITDDQLVGAMRAGVLREVEEEAKIRPSHIHGLDLLPMSYSEDFKAAGPNCKFRYQFWTGAVSAADLRKAQTHLAEIVGSPEIQASLSADKKEKDAVVFWKPTANAEWDKIRGAFSGIMTRMYYEYGMARSRK